MTDLDSVVLAAHQRYTESHPRSADLSVRAHRSLAGGNTRSVLDYAPFPIRVASAEGARITDVDGHTYIDFCGNFTAGLFGHSPKPVVDAVVQAVEGGFALGAMHEREIRLAELLCDRFDALERVRFTNSGTEANLMAIGTALHVTGRSGVGVFDGGYHGGVLSFDHGAHPLNVPHRYVTAAFNDVAALDTMFSDPDLGCVLVEAVQGAGGCIPASAEFLSELRSRCRASGSLLILDEVMTSRLAPGGAQAIYEIAPDLMTLGKYVGGGMTFGAFGGRAEVMAVFDPLAGGALTQAGTFNNNVVTMTAAVAALTELLDDDKLREVNDRGDRLRRKLNAVFESTGVAMGATGLGSMLTIHADDDRLLELFFHAMLAEGIYLARRGFVALSFEITEEDCRRLVDAASVWARRR